MNKIVWESHNAHPIHRVFFELFHQWQNELDNTELHGAFLMDCF